MKNVQTVLDAGGAIIGQACESCEIEADDGCEIRTDIDPKPGSRCFKCGGTMHHSGDMDDPGDAGCPFWQCEMCGEILAINPQTP